jgi:hypothetical protein
MNQDSEDPLLARLRETARGDRAPFPAATMAALERLAAGTLSTGEVVRLQEQAAGDPQLAAAVKAFQPLSAQARVALAEKLVQRRGQARAVAPAAAAAAPAVPSMPPVRSAPARRPPSWGRRWVMVAAPMLAGAAAVAVLMGRRPGRQALATFDLEVGLNDSEARGPSGLEGTAAPAGRAVRASSFLTLVGRPQVKVVGPLAARAFVDRGSALREVPLSEGPSDSGVVRLEGRGDRLFGTQAGPVAVHLLVGRPELIRSQAESLARGETAQGDGWQRLTARFVVGD